MRCRHCGKPIREVNWSNGPGWTHEDEMVGRWCWITGAEPEGEPEPPPPTDDRRLLRVGGIAAGTVKAVTVREDSTLVYEVEPLPAWRFPYAERREVV